MAATINRWIAGAFAVFGWIFVVFGVIMGSFGWMNSGFRAGLGIYFICGLLALAAGASMLLFRFTAVLHDRQHPHRWWAQAGSIIVLYVILGLALSATTMLD